MTEENQQLQSKQLEQASRSLASSWLVLLISQAQYLPLQKQKSCGARGFQIPLSIGSDWSPETFLRLAPHPTPSADESARKGWSRGTQTSSSAHRDQPCRKETSAAYLLCRKQAQPTVEKHGQRPTRTPNSSFVSNLLHTYRLITWNASSFLESCFYVVQESGLRIPVYRALLVISDASSWEITCSKVAWREGTFTTQSGSPLCNFFFPNPQALTNVFQVFFVVASFFKRKTVILERATAPGDRALRQKK